MTTSPSPNPTRGVVAPEALQTGPNVIGATGGSGTRVVARLVRAAGMYIGTNLNPYEDALDLAAFSDRWINSLVAAEREGEPERLDAQMADDLRDVLAGHLAAAPPHAAAWGWKEPRSIYLLRFLHRVMPSIRFLHFVRDGRDMAFSQNQKQLEKHGRTLPEASGWWTPRSVRSISLWAYVNTAAADYGERELGDRYLRVRFEDLCADPVETTRRIYGFFGLAADSEAAAAGEVTPPVSLGRWRRKRRGRVERLERRAGHALERFGYL